MEIKRFIDKTFQAAGKEGFEEFELYFVASESSSIKVFGGQVESYSDSKNQGISFRGKYENRMGYFYTESFEEEDIELLVSEALENSRIIESKDEEDIFGEKKEYVQLETYSEGLEKITVEEKIDFLLKLEKAALEKDSRVKSVNYCLFGSGASERMIRNSKGLSLSERSNSAYCYISVVVQEEENIKSGSAFKVSQNFQEFDAQALASEAVEKALAKLPTVLINSQECKAIISSEAFSSLLGAMSGIFSAENVQKGISRLKGQLEKKVAADILTIVDDPHKKDGYNSSAFDAEGVPTRYKEIIRNGVLKNYFYNLKTAKKDGVESTGNAAKGGYKGTMGISAFNLYVLPGAKSQEEMIKEVGNGILITGFTGLHSGLNSISGDFSLASEAFLIENGKIGSPLKQITVSGNFYELIEDIEDIGCDLKFDLSSIGSPSIRVKKVNIGAE